MSFIKMTIQGRYFNPSRASPMEFMVRESTRGRREVFIHKKPAVSIITGYCTESELIEGGKFNKSLKVLFHGQEWERFCCFVTMIFNEKALIGQLYNSALTFATLPGSVGTPHKFQNTSVSPLSGRRARINDTPVERSRGALYFSDVGKCRFILIYIC